LVWRLANNNRATLSEIREKWFWEDILQATLLLDIEYIENYLQYEEEDDE
jgi:hypothetical protein